MPADATYLTFSYFFNSSNNSNSKEDTNPPKHVNINTQGNSILKKENMELYKAKPQYLNTYSPVGANVSPKTLTALNNSIQCSSSSLASCINNGINNIAVSQPSEPTKNGLLLDLQWSKIKKIGTGLFNLGNNCYLNATLQCMAYTPSLSQWLVNRPHTPVCKLKLLKDFCSLCEVEKIIYDIFNSCNGCAKPNSLCFNIKKVSNVFGVGTQEDASEFFTTLLESMAKSMKYTLNPSNSTGKLSFNVLDEIFSFQFRSRITCCNCGRLSDTFENTNSWPVDVKYVADIRKGMLHFLREEVLDGENSYKCDKCNRKVRATKKYSIQTAPNVLVINLKRFDFTYAGKLTHFVTYPETLNLKTFIGENEFKTPTQVASTESVDNASSLRNVTYKLYGVLVHLGYTSHSGHYYSYVRGPNDIWYKADDQTISMVRLQDAMDQNAYILFYNRIPQQQNHNQSNSEKFLSPQSISKFGPFLPNPSCSQLTKQEQKEEETKIATPDSSKLNKYIPENKFKSTFVTIKSFDDDINSLKSKEAQEDISTNSNKTLDYDQVLKLKRIQKRKLKLYNQKKKLKELKSRKKAIKADNSIKKTDNYDSNKLALKRIKKRIKELKKSVKKEKSKLKRLKKCESCSSESSSSEQEMSESEDYNYSHKRKNFDQDETNELMNPNQEAEKINKLKKIKTTESNSLSLLKQYSSSVSSSDEEEDNDYTTIRKDRTRSSSSGSSSSASSSNENKAEKYCDSRTKEREDGEVVEEEKDSSQTNLALTNKEKSLSHENRSRDYSVSAVPGLIGTSIQNTSYKISNSEYSSSYMKKRDYNSPRSTNFWKSNKGSNYNNQSYRNNKYNKNQSCYKSKMPSWYNHNRY